MPPLPALFCFKNRTVIRGASSRIKQNKSYNINFVHVFFTECSDCSDCRKRSLIYRITVHSCRDRRECNCPNPMVDCSLQGIPIRAFKKPLLSFPSAMPDRPNCMDNIFTWQTIRSGNLGFPCPTAMKRSAFSQELRAGRTVDGAVYASAAKQAVIRRIYDCFQIIYFCNVALNSLYSIPHHYITFPERWSISCCAI